MTLLRNLLGIAAGALAFALGLAFGAPAIALSEGSWFLMAFSIACTLLIASAAAVCACAWVTGTKEPWEDGDA